MIAKPANFAARRHHGTILVVTMAVIFTMAGVVLVMCHTMAIEALAGANKAALAQADAIERGAEQYVIALLAEQGPAILDVPEEDFAAVPVGEGWFWILRPNYPNESLPAFGVVDECSKLDINATTPNTQGYNRLFNRLVRVPPLEDGVAAAAIIDWQDQSTTIHQNIGAESETYLAQEPAYYAKDAPFETLEELLLVNGWTYELLYGDGTAPPLGQTVSNLSYAISSGQSGLSGDPIYSVGLYDYLTVHSYTNEDDDPRGRINVNTAPRAVLLCLPGLTEADVDALVAQRSIANDGLLGATDTDWVEDTIGDDKADDIEDFITGESLRYSADILAVSGNGRAFKRVRVIFDASTTPATIVYRRDMSDRGWPMDKQVLAAIRAGQGPVGGVAGAFNSGGMLR